MTDMNYYSHDSRPENLPFLQALHVLIQWCEEQKQYPDNKDNSRVFVQRVLVHIHTIAFLRVDQDIACIYMLANREPKLVGEYYYYGLINALEHWLKKRAASFQSLQEYCHKIKPGVECWTLPEGWA